MDAIDIRPHGGPVDSTFMVKTLLIRFVYIYVLYKFGIRTKAVHLRFFFPDIIQPFTVWRTLANICLQCQKKQIGKKEENKAKSCLSEIYDYLIGNITITTEHQNMVLSYSQYCTFITKGKLLPS